MELKIDASGKRHPAVTLSNGEEFGSESSTISECMRQLRLRTSQRSEVRLPTDIPQTMKTYSHGPADNQLTFESLRSAGSGLKRSIIHKLYLVPFRKGYYDLMP
ncbi:Hypothetical predicted protein [Pelobates cultripes]|uniref:Uncharacterized protein n=1 Tax=Pelobates cultripes TaxID=61616 RepID=A0AAD1SSA9_PELCU|nr:Hypothetical predicted protein [Pelobates cultripes]